MFTFLKNLPEFLWGEKSKTKPINFELRGNSFSSKNLKKLTTINTQLIFSFQTIVGLLHS